jgi:gas vesicle protein
MVMVTLHFIDENALSTQRSKNNGAIIGAAVGSVAGPIGTVVGGAIGAAVGASSKPSTNNKGKV